VKVRRLRQVCYTGAMQPALVQPSPRGRISGGFLYNARMAEHGAWQLLDLVAEEVDEQSKSWPSKRPVLMDSIYLTEGQVEPFIALRDRGWAVGVMLHSFPSMIAATESGREPLRAPSAFEVEAVERLGLVVVPGRHYANMLAGCRAQIVVAEPGIDEGWRAPPRRRSGPCHLVSVGAASPRKGFLDVAEILNRRGSSGVRWTVVGSLQVDIDYARRLSEATRALPGAVLEGQKSPEEVQRIVRSADVLVMPSYDENQPLVLIEALAASVPAVAYAAGATHQMLKHQHEGLVAPIGDKAGLAVHLDALIDDEPLRYRMAVACWERQSSIPTWMAAASQATAALRAGFAALEV
jgi:glycosyltransferase involved in cell wall biosynthesis